MNNFQSRSQLIRTSLSGNRKTKLTYNKLPVSYDKIQEYKNQLLRNAKTSNIQTRINPMFRKDTNLNQRPNTLTKFNQTAASTFNRGKGISHRIMSSQCKFRTTHKSFFCKQIDNEESLIQRPSTQYNNQRVNLKRDSFINRYSPLQNMYSPLQVINTKISAQNLSQISIAKHKLKRLKSNSRRYCNSQLSKIHSSSSPTLNFNHNYLKKGQSLDRSIIINILRSKFKENIKSNNTNYSNSKRNSQLYGRIGKQIPNEFRDIIGKQQMLRMSNILSGASLKTVKMDDKISGAINKMSVKNKVQTVESMVDDHETLKSIKRW